MAKQKFTIGVFGIVRNEKNQVLFCLRNDYDLWNLPGGALEKGESPWEGVVREVKEETGLDVEVMRLIGVYSKTDQNDIVFSFECRLVGGEMMLNVEARDIRYFSFDEIPPNTSRRQVERVRDFFENRKEFVMKIQTGKSSIELLKEGKPLR